MIRAVCFDFWNTLYREDSEALVRRRQRRTDLVRKVFATAGRDIGQQAVGEALERLVKTMDSLRTEQHVSPSHEGVGHLLANALGYELSHEDAMTLAEVVSSAGCEYPPAPVDGAGNLLARLKPTLKLAVISDTGVTFGMHLVQAMRNHGLAELFDHFTWSDETLTCKPTERQFLYTLHMLNVSPSEAVHVGDLEHSDIAGAKAVGMRTIRINPAGEDSHADAVVADLGGVASILIGWGVNL